MLRTIGNNIANTANNVGALTYQVQGTTKNIQLIDESTGDLKSTFQVLGEIAENWDEMSTAEQQAIGIALAGKNQFEVFAATVGNFDQAIKASETALNSQGSAAQENAKYMESLEAAVAQFKAEWQALVNSLISSNFIKFFIDAGTAILKFANNDVGQLIIKTGLLVGSFKLLDTLLGGQLISGITLARTNLLSLIGTEEAATLATEGLSTALKSIPFLAVIATIGVLVSKITSASNNTNELTQRFNEATEALQESTNKIQQLQSEYDSLTSLASQRILTAAEEKRRDLIYQSLEAEKELQKIRAQEAYEAYIGQNVTYEDVLSAGTWSQTYESSFWNELKLIANDMLTLGAYSRDEADAVFELTKRTIGLNEAVNTSIYELSKHHREYGDVLEEEYATLVDYVVQMNAYKDAGVELSEEEENRLAKASELIGYLQIENKLMETFSTLTSNLASNGLKMLHNAWVEVNTTGEVNANTYSKLIAMFPQLANGAVQTANGYKLTEGALEALLNVENAQTNMASYLYAAASQVVSAEIQKKYAFDGTTESIVRQLKAQKAILQSQLTLKQSTPFSGKFESSINIISQLADIDNLIKEIEEYKPPAGGGAYTALSNVGSAASQADDQTKELTNSLKEQADVLKQAADLMVSNINLEIEALQRQKDEIQDVNDAIDDQIELEKALDALARAKSKKVLAYKDGQFQYISDTAAVGEAQQQLSEVQRKQARQAALDDIDKQIEARKTEQETWKNVSKAYDEYLAKQALGIDQESQNWKDRLGQAHLFADEFLKIMQTINAVESKTISVEEGQSILAQAQNFSTTLPKSDSQIINPMQSSSIPTLSTNGSLWNNFIPSSTYGGTTVIQQFGNIVLPNVTNASQFVDELSNYSQFAVQAATER